MVLATIAASAPLYVVGYDRGAYPVAGLAAALALGAFVMALCSALARSPGLDAGVVSVALRSTAVRGLVIASALTGCVVLVHMLLGASLARIPGIDAALLTNTHADWWKPIAHVAAGAALFFGVAPFAVMSVPLQMASGMSPAMARHCAYRYMHGRAYRPTSLLAAAYALATLAFVPVLGLLVPAACAFMGVRYYRMTFAESAVVPG
jgi:hypothetical protein